MTIDTIVDRKGGKTMMDWIKTGVLAIVGILFGEGFLGCLEAARKAVNLEAEELPKNARRTCLAIAISIAIISGSMPPIQVGFVIQTTVLAVLTITGVIWAQNKAFKDNPFGRKAATTATLLLCVPVSAGIIWNIVLAAIPVVQTAGWIATWKKIIWAVGPVVSTALLLGARNSSCETDGEEGHWVPQLIATLIFSALIVVLATYVCSKKGVI